MLLTHQNLTIRSATTNDAALLAAWWNDGTVMAHAGFPNGVGTTVTQVFEQIEKSSDEDQVLIIELNGSPIGEMSYSKEGNGIAGIGIKICDPTQQEKGYGKILLSMLISSLFHDFGYRKIILDTNLSNKRAQHVYERLGFTVTNVRKDCWRNQVGQLQSFVDYALTKDCFINFAVSKHD